MGLIVFRGIAYALLGVAASFTAVTMIRNACWSPDLFMLGLIFLFGLWAVGPYVALGILGATPVRYPAALWTALLGSIPPVPFGLWAYVDAFYVNLDAQSGIVFVFVPLLQWGWTALVLVVWAVLRAMARVAESEIRHRQSEISG